MFSGAYCSPQPHRHAVLFAKSALTAIIETSRRRPGKFRELRGNFIKSPWHAAELAITV
jgi:hypothetical protein